MLLGLIGGIYIRSFYPFEFILGTFLHELVHNSISRHGLKFERKLAEIRQACEVQMVVKASIASIPSCAQFAGGDSSAMAVFTKRELCLFAAELRLVLGKSEKEVNDEPEIVELD
jgi:hypothetical protein